MSKHDADFWSKAVDVRNELADRYADNPEVRYVDIGYPPADGKDTSDISIRVHLAAGKSVADPAEQVNDIPVCVVRGR